ncbi:ATP-binding protein [Butyrivibrio sp. AE2005]|uniref:ATP-binding protein n=1 Tax=Butyrivibrio sp. AE2005 TaxID=1496722 RepID=UPI00047CA2E5|nr:ATP-binding protein [Butyrivibrio sp. AE2005]
MTVEEIFRGESKDLEFKEKLPEDSKKYMKTIVAFSNGEGGRLIIGVNDDREVVGVDQTAVFTMIDKITNAISDSCEPLIIPDIAPQAIGDKTVIVVEISAGRQRPYYLKSLGMDKGTFIRTAGSTRLADRPFIQEMYYEDENRSFDNVVNKDIEVTDADINSFCEDMKKEAQRNCLNDKDAEKVKTPTKNNLITWGILKEENGVVRPTYAYYYLRGLDGIMSQIQCAVFKGNTRGIFVDKREYEGNLWEQVEQAYQFVLRNIHLGARIKGIHRQDVYELPPESIRELIINAVVNCSFLQGSLVQVAIYDNRLEISSPGGLMPGVTIEKMKEGFSKVRNHGIANAFVYMNLIEQWGSGIPKILAQTKEYGLPEVEFIDMGIALRVNMYRALPEDGRQAIKVSDKKQATSGNYKRKTIKASECRTMFVEYMSQHGASTTAEMAAISGLSPQRTRAILAKMVDDGIVIAEGSNKTRKYRLQ